jgi:hypothetical protein
VAEAATAPGSAQTLAIQQADLQLIKKNKIILYPLMPQMSNVIKVMITLKTD